MLRLLLVRHALTAERPALGGTDADRPLTGPGRENFELAARALIALAPGIDRVASSPLRRARETAEILARGYGHRAEPIEIPSLAPGGSPTEAARELGRLGGGDALAAVGHEPDLAMLAAYLLAGSERSFLRFKKGSAAWLEVADGLRPGTATLLWHLTPAQLRELAP